MTEDGKKAKLAALRSLSRRAYHSDELNRKLVEKGFPAPIVNEILEELKSSGFLNDGEWIDGFIRKEIRSHHGPLLIAQKLRQKGANSDEISVHLRDSYPLEVRQKEIRALLAKLKGKPKQNVVASLNRRGFSISEILSNYNEN